MKHLNFSDSTNAEIADDFSFTLRLPFQKTIRGKSASEAEALSLIEIERTKYVRRCWDAGTFGRTKTFVCPLNPV